MHMSFGTQCGSTNTTHEGRVYTLGDSHCWREEDGSERVVLGRCGLGVWC
jgi:hypothetical protein